MAKCERVQNRKRNTLFKYTFQETLRQWTLNDNGLRRQRMNHMLPIFGDTAITFFTSPLSNVTVTGEY